MRHQAELIAALALLVLGTAQAADNSSKELDRLRPTGPVTITADRAEVEQDGPMRYTGNVALDSNTLTLRGDALELKQFADGQFEARIDGKPARLNHAGDPTASGTAAQPISAQANQLLYDARTGIVDLIGGARLSRGGDEITGSSVRYDVAARRIRASGGDKGQVKIVIQPPANKDRKPEGKQ
jgi:lipopolysaccharide export system protein LptA